MSRYENGEEYPPLATALALQVIFNASPRRIFNALYADVESRVMDAGAALEELIRHEGDYASKQKRQLLEGMAARARNLDAA